MTQNKQTSRKLDVSLKAISFSLWKEEEDDKLGAIANAIYAYYTFPGWDCIFYIPEGYDEETVLRLSELHWVTVERIPKCRQGDNSPILAKFLAASIEDYDYIVFRSCQSRLIKRDAVAIKEWIKSGKDFHIIYDNPAFGFMPECSWGVKGGVIKNAHYLVNSYMHSLISQPWLECVTKNEKSEVIWNSKVAELFVQNVIFPLTQKSCLRHDEISRDVNGNRVGKPISLSRSFDSPYIGEVINHLETPKNPELRLLLYSQTMEVGETLVDRLALEESMNQRTPKRKEKQTPIFEEQYQNIKKIDGAI